MTLFFVAFFSLYALLHLYLLIKLRSTFLFRWSHMAMTFPFLILMIFCPLIIRQLEKQGLDVIARILSYTGYIWMGLLVLFCSVSMPVDIFGFIVKKVNGFLRRDYNCSVISNRVSFILSALISVVIVFYGYFEAQDIRIERREIRSSKISRRIRVVQISDLHIGLIIRDKRVKKVVRMINEERPDIVVSTGDLIDGQIDSLGGISVLLKGIRARYGKFAVTGNHEFYAGLSQAIRFTEESGFMVLRGEGIVVAEAINIVGVDDPTGKAYGLYIDVKERDLLSRLPEDKFTLLLKHRPFMNKDSRGLVDLQLSGHTHKGQIFPFSIITWLYYPVQAGGINITNNSYLYVSRGTGTWGPPIRFLSPPEITVIDIVPPKG